MRLVLAWLIGVPLLVGSMVLARAAFVPAAAAMPAAHAQPPGQVRAQLAEHPDCRQPHSGEEVAMPAITSIAGEIPCDPPTIQ